MKPIIIKELLYADDILITANIKTELQKAVVTWKQLLDSSGMKINTRKSEIIIVSKTEQAITIVIDETEINMTNNMKYSAIIDSQGHMEAQ